MIDLGWYVPKNEGQLPRWVLATTSKHVLYGTGGQTHRECQIRTFKRWLKQTKAERQTQQ